LFKQIHIFAKPIQMKKTTVYLLSALTIGVLTMAATCKKATTTATPVAKTSSKTACKITPTYTANVKPIIDEACGTKCHSGQWKADGIELTSYALVSAESKKARFLGSLNHKANYDPMPKKADKLSDSVLQILQCWVDGGSPE
jgi:uncharacterized membrane protein